MNTQQLFSGKADDYTVGRPGYSEMLINEIYEKIGLSENSVVADIGSGTGKFARQILEKGCGVICVEPNDDMRKIAERELSSFPKALFTDGNSDHTKIADRSVSLVTAAQAFHWFDPIKFRSECRRILKKDGTVALIWNTRVSDSAVNRACFDIFSRFCPNFKGFSGGTGYKDERISEFFGGKYELLEYDNPLKYDKAKFISRSLSASYSLKDGYENFGQYIKELEAVFNKFSENETLTMPNRSVAYIGKV